MSGETRRLWAARALIGAVLGANMSAAVPYWLWPGRYASSFELAGVAGQVMTRSVGLLFVMWNVPYAAAFIHPLRGRWALGCALVMQTIGLVGEAWLLAGLEPGHAALRSVGRRFVAFDSVGWLLLLAAWALSPRRRD